MKINLSTLLIILVCLFFVISSCDSPTRTNVPQEPEIENGGNNNDDNNNDDGDGDGDNDNSDGDDDDSDGGTIDPSILNTFTNYDPDNNRYSGVFIVISKENVLVYSQVNEPGKTPHFIKSSFEISRMWETEFTGEMDEIYFELTNNRYVKVFRDSEDVFRVRLPIQMHYENLRITNQDPEVFGQISEGPEPFKSVFHTFRHSSGPRYAMITDENIQLFLNSRSLNQGPDGFALCYDHYTIPIPSFEEFNTPVSWVRNLDTQQFGVIEFTAHNYGDIILKGSPPIGTHLDFNRVSQVFKREELNVWENGSMRIHDCKAIEPIEYFNDLLGQVYVFDMEVVQSSNNQTLYSGTKTIQVTSITPTTNSGFKVEFNETVEAIVYQDGQPTDEILNESFPTIVQLINNGHNGRWSIISETNVMFGTNFKNGLAYNYQTDSFYHASDWWYAGMCHKVPGTNFSTFTIDRNTGLGNYYHEISPCYVAPGFKTTFTRVN